MAKKSKVVAQQRREAIVARYAERRAALKETIRRGTPEEAEAAMKALQKMPRDASPVRLRNRDVVDGRPRGHLRRFGLSRVRFRKMAHAGELPGVVKSSW